MSAEEKGAQMAWGTGDAPVSLETAEDPKGSGVHQQVPDEKAEVPAAQAWWTKAPLAGSQQHMELLRRTRQAGLTPAPATSSPFAIHIVMGHDSHQQRRDLAFAK